MLGERSNQHLSIYNQSSIYTHTKIFFFFFYLFIYVFTVEESTFVPYDEDHGLLAQKSVGYVTTTTSWPQGLGFCCPPASFGSTILM